MGKVYIVGVGMTPFGKFLDRSIKELSRQAVEAALADAGAQKGDMQAAFFANATQSPLEGQHMVGGQIALRDMGFERLPVFNVENACASSSSALNLAYAYVRGGLADVALAVGAEKMYGSDREKTFSVFNGAWDVHTVDATVSRLEEIGRDVPEPAAAQGGERSVFMDVYAALAKLHMKTFGSTQRDLAAVASKNHNHSVHNPLSQYRKPMSVDEVLAARSISWPLTLPMCSPVSDGAAAAILMSESAMKRFARGRAVEVRASVVRSGQQREPGDYQNHICRLAALQAYEAAGVGPQDVGVAEVHDASAFAELLQTELLGFCPPGEGGPLAQSGATTLGGRLPVNPSGGLESKGHPIGATGLGQVFELVSQLRGEAGPRQVEGARIALAENGGGFYGYEEAVACVTILGKMNIAQLLVAAARAHPERPAISVGKDTVATYRQLAERVARLAGGLRKRCGGKPGARVAIVAANSPQYIETMWAAWHAGLCVVPVNAKLHPKEVAFIQENCGVSLTFTDDWQDHAALFGDAIPLQPVASNDPAWLFYTSGTTGRPKGATLTHHNLLQMSLRNYADIDEVGPEDCILHVAPLSHASGLFSIFHAGKGSNQVIPESRGFKEDELAGLIDHYRNCLLFLAPTMLNRFASHAATGRMRTQNLKTLIYGGAPMYLEDLKRALARLGPCLWQGYGQGETPNTICYLSKAWHARSDHPRYDAILSTVGIPRTGIQVRVVDGEDRELPAGEIGEVIVKSEVTMSGYWGNPEASARALKGGWLHTGDLGAFDEHGFLSLKDRSKDVIISGGSNIYPREVEEVLLMHPGVLEASVIGRPSKEWGEEVVAFVVKKPAAAVQEPELDALCLENIARFKRPKAYFFIDALPKSNYGKILKTDLRAVLAKETH